MDDISHFTFLLKNNNKMKTYLTLFTLALCINMGISQHDHARCGMTTEDQQPLVDFVEYYNKMKDTPQFAQRADKLNVPIKFHMVARADGTGRIEPISVLNQFEKLRKDFEAADMNLYLYENSFNFLDNTGIYLNPGTATTSVRNAKDPKAMNVFITENANTSSGMGTVLGFYSPTNDYIVIRITDVNAVTASLSHEFGHMFSLPHTFNGWESEPYNESAHGNPVLLTVAPGSSRPVELVNGSNCTAAGDRICDTPPDYNFGFTAGGCNWNKQILDKNSELIEPMIDNYMGYFIGCDSYIFTQGQIDLMRANFMLNNYNGNNRNFLRSDYVPTSDTVSNNYEILSPEKGVTTDYYDFVEMDWDDAEGATSYQLQIRIIRDGASSLFFDVVSESHYEMTTLLEGDRVKWTVKPFNESYGGTPIRKSDFRVGSGASATDDLADYVSSFVISPNPANRGHELNIAMDVSQATSGTLSLYNVAGSVLSSEVINLKVGMNQYTIPTIGNAAGLYFIKMESELGSIYRKVVLK